MWNGYSVITTAQSPCYLALEKQLKLICNCYFSFQFCFRLNFSTNNALSIVGNIPTQLDEGKYSAGVFADLKKTFDTGDHNILLKTPDYYGVRGNENKWFASYLKNRK